MVFRTSIIYVLSLFCYSNISFAVEVGDSIPECLLKKFHDDSNISLHQPGKTLYIDFWASWCGPCAQSLPFLEQLNFLFKDRGFEVIAINLDEIKADAENFLQDHPVNLTTAINPDADCPKLFSVQAMPSSYIVDRQGKIRHIQKGFNQSEKAQLQHRLEQILSE